MSLMNFPRINKARVALRSKTVVTALIDFLPGGRDKALQKSFLFFGLPDTILLTIFFWQRKETISCEPSTIAFVYLASIWLWVGPYLVWRYEQVILHRHWALVKRVSVDYSDYLKYRQQFRGGLARNTIAALVTLLAWVVLVVLAFVGSLDFMQTLGIEDPQGDPWWFAWIAGVALYAYVSGLGLLGVIRTTLLSKELQAVRVELRPYHPDKHGGLGCLSSLLIETAVIFSSGALFVPILISLAQVSHNWGADVTRFLVFVYSLAILLSFVIPAYFVHIKVAEEIRVYTDWTVGEITKFGRSAHSSSIRSLIYLDSLRTECKDLRDTITWPVDVEKGITLFGTAALPILLLLVERSLSSG